MAVIQCQMQASFTYKDIGYLKVSSIKFISCNIQHNSSKGKNNKITATIEIFNFFFVNSKENIALLVTNQNASLNLKVSINNCTFSSNNGSILCTDGGFRFVIIKIIFLFITDTLFWSNWQEGYGGALCILNVDLKLQRSQFA